MTTGAFDASSLYLFRFNASRFIWIMFYHLATGRNFIIVFQCQHLPGLVPVAIASKLDANQHRVKLR